MVNERGLRLSMANQGRAPTVDREPRAILNRESNKRSESRLQTKTELQLFNRDPKRAPTVNSEPKNGPRSSIANKAELQLSNCEAKKIPILNREPKTGFNCRSRIADGLRMSIAKQLELDYPWTPTIIPSSGKGSPTEEGTSIPDREPKKSSDSQSWTKAEPQLSNATRRRDFDSQSRTKTGLPLLIRECMETVQAFGRLSKSSSKPVEQTD